MNAPKTIDAILRTNPQRINLVDVGAYAGSFMVEIRPMFGSTPIVSLTGTPEADIIFVNESLIRE